jgi:hypothetical protein
VLSRKRFSMIDHSSKIGESIEGERGHFDDAMI